MRKKGLLAFLALVLVFSLVIAGCAQPAPEEEVAPPPEEEVAPEEEVPPPPEEEVPSEPKVFKIGGIIPLTGYLALWGLAEKRTINFAIEKINEAGGVRVGDDTYQLEFIFEDFASDPTKAVDAAYKLIFEDDVQIIYGGDDNSIAAIQPLLEENEIISLLHTQVPFTGLDFPHTFHIGLPTGIEGGYGVFQYMRENYPEVETIFTINQDDVQGHLSGTADVVLSEYYGLEPVAPSEYFSVSNLDFTPIATKIANLQPDVLNIGATFDAYAGLILEAVHEMGTPPWKVVVSRYTNSQAITWAGFEPELSEGLISWSHDYTSELYSPDVREMAEEYIDRYGGMDVWGMTFVDVPFIVKSILERADSTDKRDIYEYLNSPGATIDSILWGELGFGGNEWWYYGADRQMMVPTPVAVGGDGLDVTKRLIPWEEYKTIWPYMTQEALP